MSFYFYVDSEQQRDEWVSGILRLMVKKQNLIDDVQNEDDDEYEEELVSIKAKEVSNK